MKDFDGKDVPVEFVEDLAAKGSKPTVICALAKDDSGLFTDNVSGTCSRCEAAIIYRPNVPEVADKICFPCALMLMSEDKLSGTHH